MAHETTRPGCERCGRLLTAGAGDFYAVSILAVADPSPPLLDDERDVSAEIRRLVRHMKGMSEQQLMDQVYRRVVVYLCNPCYAAWIADPVGRGPR